MNSERKLGNNSITITPKIVGIKIAKKAKALYKDNYKTPNTLKSNYVIGKISLVHGSAE